MSTRLAASVAAQLRGQPLTYSEVGGTRSRPPAGDPQLAYERQLGQGSVQFERAAAALFAWQMHDRAGLRPETSAAEAAEGEVAVLHFGVSRLAIAIPVRVVYVVAEDRRRGFAYGTLPGHPETGEEAFIVEHRADDAVVFTITAFSRPGRWFTRLAGPAARLVQRRMTATYASALRKLTVAAPG